MSTNGSISIILSDGSVKQIYNHWDAHLDSLGEMLQENYNSYDKAKELVEMGGVSSVGATIKESRFYHRDNKESIEINNFKTQKNFEKKCQMESYDYIFCNNEWLYITRSEKKMVYTNLNEAIHQYKKDILEDKCKSL